MGRLDGSIPNQESVLLDAFEGWLTQVKHLSPKVAYEYKRTVVKFLKAMYGTTLSLKDPDFVFKLNRFLDIPNSYTYRNTLASLKQLFEMLGIKEYLQDYKYKASMPSFSIATPSFDEVLRFRDALGNDRIRFYFEFGIVTAIRPEHLLRLTKNLIDTRNRMINTWMKTFTKKNFFFSFYTEDLAPEVEKYLSKLTENDKLFDLASRTIQKSFRLASRKTSVKITPKMMRKFATNWLRRHGMIPEDVDAITSHTPYSIVARHYLDTSRIHAEYDRAMKDVNFGE